MTTGRSRTPLDATATSAPHWAIFSTTPARRRFEWPIKQESRHHIHSRIDQEELPVDHRTIRKGRPYTLVLTKTMALFEREEQARRRDEDDLGWLGGRPTARVLTR